ncbi:hypothetical protein HaLaN_08641, partial [Haematococcus lacustris]
MTATCANAFSGSSTKRMAILQSLATRTACLRQPMASSVLAASWPGALMQRRQSGLAAERTASVDALLKALRRTP